MTLGFAVKIIIQVFLVLLLAYGIMNEEKLIAFENELFPVLKFCFHKYILKDIKRPEKTKKAKIKVISGKEPESDTKQSVA